MTCLSLIQDAAIEVGVDPPTTAVNSTEPNARLLLQFAQKAGGLISERHDWQKLTTQHTFVSVALEPQALAFPADYRSMNYMSDVWDRSRNLRYIGPTNIKDWQWLRNGAVAGASGVIGYWRILGGLLNLFPAPPAGNTIALEYQSNNWAANGAGVPQARFLADTDVARIPETLIQMEVIWRWKHRHGLDYAEDMKDAELQIERACSRDKGLDVIAVGGGNDAATQASTWPGVINP